MCPEARIVIFALNLGSPRLWMDIGNSECGRSRDLGRLQKCCPIPRSDLGSPFWHDDRVSRPQNSIHRIAGPKSRIVFR